MFGFNQIMALKELVAGQQQPQIVENHYKGSMLNPGQIGAEGKKKQIAKPFAKVQAKIGQKYIPKKNIQKDKQQIQKPIKKVISQKHKIWNQQQVAQLPISKEETRPAPQFETMYRQKVGTEDVFLGLSGVDPSSNHCQQILYKIHLPGTTMKQVQVDLNQKQMVIQTKKYYLMQFFQYKMDIKKASAKFIADKQILELILPIIRQQF